MRRVIWILVLLLAACPAEEGASSKRPSPARSSAPVEAPKGVGVFQFETSEDTAGFLVFFRSTTCTLAQAEAALREEGLSVARKGKRLVVRDSRAGGFRILIDRGPHVPVEAKEIGAGTEHAEALTQCDVRFDVQAESLSLALAEANTMIRIQVTLCSASQGLIFLPWNGNLFTPN